MKGQNDPGADHQLTFSITLASVLGLGGLLTLGIVIISLLAGLWLDQTLNSKPVFTILLMIISAPISIFVMYRVAMSSIAKMTPPAKKTEGEKQTDL